VIADAIAAELRRLAEAVERLTALTKEIHDMLERYAGQA